MRDRGSVTLLFAGLLVLLVTAGAGAVRVTEAVVLRHRARAAADAVALASATHPWASEAIAQANRAQVVATRWGPGWVEVDVERQGARARARATLGARGEAGLDPRIMVALRAAEARLGRAIHVISGFRTYEEQRALWEARSENPFPVALPGTSKHERGLAADVSVADAALIEALRVGLCRPYPNDPVHLELC